mgnify:CR=1 FL=1|jgi:glutamate synthase domain-containing protein 3
MGKNKERAKFFSSLFTDFKKDRGEEIMREDQLYRIPSGCALVGILNQDGSRMSGDTIIDDYPVIMIGGSSRDFLGEYMAGGLIVVLGLGYDSNCSPVGKFIASGMNGGKLFIRGRFQPEQAGPGIGIEKPIPEDFDEINLYLQEFSADLSLEIPELKCDDFVKVFPTTTRPYGRVYAY